MSANVLDYSTIITESLQRRANTLRILDMLLEEFCRARNMLTKALRFYAAENEMF